MSTVRTFVIGHKNPDTDSIVSAVALAELKGKEGAEGVEPARAGDVNPQTAFVLDALGVAPPRYLPDVHPRARDVMSSKVVSVPEEMPLSRVMELMREEKVRFVPVLDPGGRPAGVITLMEIARRFLAKMDVESSREVVTSLPNIRTALGAEVVCDFMGEGARPLSVFVGAMAEESFVETVRKGDPARSAVIVGDRSAVQMRSIKMGMALVVVTGGFGADPAVVKAARENNVSVVVSPYDTATTATLMRQSTPASDVCLDDFETVSPDEFADGLKTRLANVTGLCVTDDEGILTGVVTRSSIIRRPGTKLILVDHNELSQAVDGAGEADIVAVVDHHRIGNFTTSRAIPFICEPVGSTSTLVSELFARKGIAPEKTTAGLLLGGVLSDTVMLKSPTTTERDREIIRFLEKHSGLDHGDFGNSMFAATSSLKKRGPKAAVRGDHKIFDAKGGRFGIGQVEVIGFDEFHSEKDGLAEELEKVKEEKNLKLSALLVTDIAQGTSLLLATGEREIMYNLGYPKVEDWVYELRDVISRKKQVVPHMLSVFNDTY